MLSVGIIGLPNAGKSTLFNALTAGHGHAEVAGYPFTTIEPNVGVVPVPDPRLAELERLLEPDEAAPCFIRFIDIAGLVEGASRGEGLGNRFLGEVRGVDALAHVLRCFEGAGVAHVYGEVDPVRDAGVVETELLLADLEVLDRAVARRQRDWATRPREHAAERARFEAWRRALEEGTPLAALDLDPEDRRELKALGLLTGRPVLYVANVGEEGYGRGESAQAASLRANLPAACSPTPAGPSPAASSALPSAPEGGGGRAEVVEVSAQLEWELARLEPGERREFMAELGIETSGLERLVAAAFHLLGLIRFYTVAHGKLRAWEIPRGTRAPEAAGQVHSDMERGFIRAQVAGYEDLAAHGGLAELHRLGRLRTEGKDYELADGDVVEFLFSS